MSDHPHQGGQDHSSHEQSGLLESLFGSGLFLAAGQEGDSGQSTTAGASPHMSTLLDLLHQQGTPKPLSRMSSPQTLTTSLSDMPSLLSQPFPTPPDSPFSPMVFVPQTTVPGTASLESMLNFSTPLLPKTAEAIRKVESLKEAIENLPPGAYLEDVLSPNSQAFLRAQQQQMGAPFTSAGGVIQSLFQKTGVSPPKETSPSAFMNLGQGGGEEPQQEQAPQPASFPPLSAGFPGMGQRRMSLEQFLSPQAEGPSSTEMAAKFIMAQQERLGQRKTLPEQHRGSQQDLEALASPRPRYPPSNSTTAQQQRAAKIWQSGPLVEALNEFIGEQPQSMHSGMLPQDNLAGARARGLAFPSGQSGTVRKAGIARAQVSEKSGDAQSEKGSRSPASEKRPTIPALSASAEETSAESVPQKKRVKRALDATSTGNPLELRVPPAPVFTGSGPQVEPLRAYSVGAQPKLAPALGGFVYPPVSGTDLPQSFGGVTLPARSMETQEKKYEEKTPETHIKTTRARRGQATDPHSIAERLRRERISERMRQLQALIPHHKSNDKATMLGEIIEYIKFMQMQVHILGLGKEEAPPLAAALPAGLPEVAKGPVEGPLPPQDATVAQELLTHLETGPDRAVQYLLERGLCLMPAPLAARVISGPGQAVSHEAPRGSPRHTASGTQGDQCASVASSLPGNVTLTSSAQAVPTTPPERELAPTPQELSTWRHEEDANTQAEKERPTSLQSTPQQATTETKKEAIEGE